MAEKQPSKSFLLRLDRPTMEALERWAAAEFRSVNGQLQWIVADALRRAGRTPSASPPQADSDSAHSEKP